MPKGKRDTGSKIVVANKWENVDSSVENPVRNTGQDYLKFVNSSYFNEEARRFMEWGYYTNAPVGTIEYQEYWKEQRRRCFEGYSVGGVRIPGRYYFFLNFGQILARRFNYTTGTEEGRKRITFPRFLDHQYYLSHEIEKAFKEGPYKNDDNYEKQGMIIAKARRKGATYYFADSLVAYNYNFLQASQNFIGAYEKEHYNVTLSGVHYCLDHLNKNTYWRKRRQKKTARDNFRASVRVTDSSGVEYEEGYKSEVKAISFKDSAFKSIGASADLFLFEEAGRFPDLMTTYRVTEPLWRDGGELIGSPVIFGTGGDIEKGAVDFATMFYDPESYGLKAFDNIYDDKATGKCGYFIDNMWYYPGKLKKQVFVSSGWQEQKLDMVDDQGNSMRDRAEEFLDQKRETAKDGDQLAYQMLITQEPKTPREAFLRPTGSPFPVKELADHEANLRSNPKKWKGPERVGDLIYEPETGEYKFEIDETLFPIDKYPADNKSSREGALVIWEMPQKNDDGKIPEFLYIISVDPYDDDISSTDSLGSAFVMNRLTGHIAAEYTGRPPTAKDFYEKVRRMAEFYNGTILYESNKKGLFSYFEYKNCLYLLSDTPKYLQDKSLIKYRAIGNDSKGVKLHNKELITHAASLLKQYLLEEAYTQKDDVKMMNLHTIKSLPLLQELMYWNFDDYGSKKKNFDRCLLQGSEISVKSGIKKIEDIGIGDEVLTQSGEYHFVNKIHRNIRNDNVVNIKVVGDYRWLSCTSDHPIFIRRFKKKPYSFHYRDMKKELPNGQFIDASECKKGDYIMIPRRKHLSGSSISSDVLYLMGWYLSDGYINDGYLNIFLHEDQYDIAVDLVDIINRNFLSRGTRVKRHKRKNGVIVPSYVRKSKKAFIVRANSSKRMWQIRYHDKNLCDFLIRNCGGPNDRKLSDYLYNLRGLMPLLKGFFEGDGHFRSDVRSDGSKRSSLELSTIYRNLAFQIRQILLDHGIWNTIRYISNENRKLNAKPQYSINITNNNIKRLIKGSKKFTEELSIGMHERKHYIKEKDAFYIPIKDIYVEEKEVDTYNLSVDKDETYVANGILTHNCSSMFMMMIYRESLTASHVEVDDNSGEELHPAFAKHPLFKNNRDKPRFSV